MKETMHHPSAEALEAFVEGALGAPDRAALRSHLMSCARCDSDADEWRSLFAVLRTLPRFAPAPGFGERVMASVHVYRPWYTELRGFLEWLLPRTTWGWATAAAVFALPVVAGFTLVAWLLSKSYVTAYGLWVFATDRFAAAAGKLASGVSTRVMETDVGVLLARGFETASAAGTYEIGLLAAGATFATAVSTWVLYRFLFSSTDRGSNHVTFSF